MEVHTLTGGHRIGSVSVVLSGEALERLERAAEAMGRTPDDLATCAVEEAVLEWHKANPVPPAQKALPYVGPNWDDPAAEFNGRRNY